MKLNTKGLTQIQLELIKSAVANSFCIGVSSDVEGILLPKHFKLVLDAKMDPSVARSKSVNEALKYAHNVLAEELRELLYCDAEGNEEPGMADDTWNDVEESMRYQVAYAALYIEATMSSPTKTTIAPKMEKTEWQTA